MILNFKPFKIISYFYVDSFYLPPAISVFYTIVPDNWAYSFCKLDSQ